MPFCRAEGLDEIVAKVVKLQTLLYCIREATMALPCMHWTLHVIEITSVLSAKQE